MEMKEKKERRGRGRGREKKQEERERRRKREGNEKKKKGREEGQWSLKKTRRVDTVCQMLQQRDPEELSLRVTRLQEGRSG